MKNILSLLLIIWSIGLQAQDTSQYIIPGRTNGQDQFDKPYIILISADGFRYDLADKYQAANLLRLRASGVAADYMQSVFPSLTFPNHYSIATGEYPDHDGIVDNTFYDPARQQVYSIGNRKAVEDSSWYGATPIWVLAEKQRMLTASYYWVGAEAAIQGIRPTYYYKFNNQTSMKDRIQAVRSWLLLGEAKRPHLITFYIPDVDHQEHMFGVNSKQTRDAVHDVDEAVGRLVQTIDSLHLPVNYIFVSDHGMADLDTLHTLSLPNTVDTSHFIILNSLSIVHMYARDSSFIKTTYLALQSAAKDYDVYMAANLPDKWHYNKKNDRYNRIGDIILVAHAPKVFNLSKRSLPAATHGFDPTTSDMHASFYAWGPAFKSHQQIREFENIHIYPLIAYILGLKIREPIDGNLKILQPILKGYAGNK